jgi:integrase
VKGVVFPRPHKWVTDGRGRRRKAPLRPSETWIDPETGRTVKAGPSGSTWTWQITTGSKKAGTRRHHSKGGYPTRKAAEADLAEALAALGKGDHRPLMRPEVTPLGDYLADWLAGRDDLKPSSRRGYSNTITAWIAPRDERGDYRPAPYLGAVPLRDLGPDQFTRLFAHLREGGARRGKPLGTRSVKLCDTVLKMALADAAEAGRLPYNPITRVPRRQRPKHRPRQVVDRYWSPDEAKSFLEHTRPARLWPLWCLALDSGARRGELAALRWPQLDIDDAVMTVHSSRTLIGADEVEGTTKSGKPREVDLHPATVAALRGWRTRQARERLAAGEVWQGGEPGKTGYVFTDELGVPYRPDRFLTMFDQAQEGTGLPRLVFHGLRHTSATTALKLGVPPHVVAERLGHAIEVLMKTYAHVIPGQGVDAARIIGGAIYGETGTESG